MILDANVLLYAHDRSSPRHEAARRFLESALSGDEPIRLPVLTVLAFIRLSTNPAIFERPLAPQRAIGHVQGWLARQVVSLVTPTERHWSILADLADRGQARGALLMDAHLAALAIEHGATLVSTDRGMARFPGVRLLDPTDPGPRPRST